MVSSRGEAEALARTGPSSRRWRPVHIVLLAWSLVVAGYAHRVVGPKLVLTNHYGWARVWGGEGLSVVERHRIGSPVARPSRDKRDSRWLVSNGERIRVWRVERQLCWFAAWVAMMAVTVPAGWLLWHQLVTKRLRGPTPGIEPRRPC